jgi:hypothetical protein
MATTTNYSWTTPDDTALVKDGAAAIRTLGSSIDTTTKNLNPSTTAGDIEYRSSTPNVNTRLPLGTAGQVLKVNSGATAPEWATDATGMTNPLTTTGDTIYSSSGSTPARLGIGTTGQVLTVAGGVPSWAAAPVAGANWSLLNSGGTSLSGTSTSITGITGQDKLLIIIDGARKTSAANRDLQVQFNTDTGSNYVYSGARYIQTGATSGVVAATSSATSTSIVLAGTAANAGSFCDANLLVTGCNAAGVKAFQGSGSGVAFTDNSQTANFIGGIYNSASTISSVEIKLEGATFDQGTVFVYGSA